MERFSIKIFCNNSVFNYRLSDIHAALGVSQLKRVDENLQRRREIAATYANALADKP